MLSGYMQKIDIDIDGGANEFIFNQLVPLNQNESKT